MMSIKTTIPQASPQSSGTGEGDCFFIRAVEIDGEPWLVGKDVAAALGYSDTKSALSNHVDKEDKQILQRGQIATLEIPNRSMT